MPCRGVGVRKTHVRGSVRVGRARRSDLTGRAHTRQSSVLKTISFPRHLHPVVTEKVETVGARKRPRAVVCRSSCSNLFGKEIHKSTGNTNTHVLLYGYTAVI